MDDLEHFLTLPRNLWLIAAVTFLLIEALGVPGVGLLFAGIGALLTGVSIYGGLVPSEATILQFVIFFVGSAISAGVLWKPLHRFHLRQKTNHYDNMNGQVAVIAAEGVDREDGRALWSGTKMHAQLADSSKADALSEGDKAIIVEVRGSCLILVPKSEYQKEPS